MNEYEKYLFELLVYHKGNFVTAEVLADLYGADLQKDLQACTMSILATSNSNLQGILKM